MRNCPKAAFSLLALTSVGLVFFKERCDQPVLRSITASDVERKSAGQLRRTVAVMTSLKSP